MCEFGIKEYVKSETVLSADIVLNYLSRYFVLLCFLRFDMLMDSKQTAKLGYKNDNKQF